MQKKLFKVTTKCGHVRRHNCILIDFPIIAESGREAAYIARWMPRAKHHDKYCIVSCMEISEDEYIELCESNENDQYLKCKSHYDQMLIEDLPDRIFFFERPEVRKHDMQIVNFKQRKFKELMGKRYGNRK